MAKKITIFGQEVTMETMRISAVAINEGFVVTAEAVLDNDDILCAHTVGRAKASFDDVTDEMMPKAVEGVNAWIEEHTNG